MKNKLIKATAAACLLIATSTYGYADLIVRGACSNCTRTTNGTTVTYSVTCTGQSGECVHQSDTGTVLGPGCNCAIISNSAGSGSDKSFNQGVVINLEPAVINGQQVTHVVLQVPLIVPGN